MSFIVNHVYTTFVWTQVLPFISDWFENLTETLETYLFCMNIKPALLCNNNVTMNSFSYHTLTNVMCWKKKVAQLVWSTARIYRITHCNDILDESNWSAVVKHGFTKIAVVIHVLGSARFSKKTPLKTAHHGILDNCVLTTQQFQRDNHAKSFGNSEVTRPNFREKSIPKMFWQCAKICRSLGI